jgi:signal recognition particle subunit SRP68
MQSLHNKLQHLLNHYRGLVELSNLNANSAIATEKHMASAAPILERLNEYPAAGVDLKNLVTYPPKLKPVPVKPLFLDLAWNYIEYPGRGPVGANGEATTAAPATAGAPANEAAKEQKKAGWGWFGRS